MPVQLRIRTEMTPCMVTRDDAHLALRLMGCTAGSPAHSAQPHSDGSHLYRDDAVLHSDDTILHSDDAHSAK